MLKEMKNTANPKITEAFIDIYNQFFHFPCFWYLQPILFTSSYYTKLRAAVCISNFICNGTDEVITILIDEHVDMIKGICLMIDPEQKDQDLKSILRALIQLTKVYKSLNRKQEFIDLMDELDTRDSIEELIEKNKEKAERNFQRISAVFWTKYDKWSLFSLFCHTFTVISCILFIIYGHLYTDQLPFTNVLMCLCSSLHCFLLFRYLQQKPSTMIIVNVIFNAALTFLQFLVGCMVVFAAYLILGCSMFGTSCVNFATFTQGAVVLIAVIHGDSIQDLYDSVMTRSDVPWWCGFVYMSVWVFFSLTIMFNISISIFEESLTREIYKQSDKGHSDEPAPIEALTMNLPRSYRTIF